MTVVNIPFIHGGVLKTGPLSVLPSQGLSHSVGHAAPIGSHVPTYMGLTRKAGIPRVSPPRVFCTLRYIPRIRGGGSIEEGERVSVLYSSQYAGLFLFFLKICRASLGIPSYEGCSICKCRGSLPLRGWFHRGRSQLCSPKGGESAGGMGNTPAFRVPITYIGKIVVAFTYE